MSMRFAKGHGTGNDFVILPDADGGLDLTPELTARLCDRHTGLGADGVLRVVRSAAMSQAPAGAEWFMDYRNADGSLAEMCGNGIRVFARYLLEQGLAAGPELVIGTRAGLRPVRAEPDGRYTAAMGPAVVTGTGGTRLGRRELEGLAISVGNPHLACVVGDPVADYDLSAPPGLLDPAQFPEGANVEVVQITGPRIARMRVYERGSGPTLSCGTGAVAAALAAALVARDELPAGEPELAWAVEVPGGRLTVTLSATASLLTGPAVLVGAGELDPDWLAGDTAAAAPALAGRP